MSVAIKKIKLHRIKTSCTRKKSKYLISGSFRINGQYPKVLWHIILGGELSNSQTGHLDEISIHLSIRIVILLWSDVTLHVYDVWLPHKGHNARLFAEDILNDLDRLIIFTIWVHISSKENLYISFLSCWIIVECKLKEIFIPNISLYWVYIL